ncbi:threonyl-tRNA synthetase [Tilletia horrida]|nr:threonyl-tRNA synthetase [Tilletia horrida]
MAHARIPGRAAAAASAASGARLLPLFESAPRMGGSIPRRLAAVASSSRIRHGSSSTSTSGSTKEAHTHQTLGRQYSLFFTHEASPGTPFFQPHGWRIVQKLLRVVRDLYDRQGYDEVCSPQIYSEMLWKTSGHWENYRSEMFGVEGYRERDAREAERIDARGRGAAAAAAVAAGHHAGCPAHGHAEHGAGDELAAHGSGLKPMNCPGHCLMFAHEERSYRDLPIRFAEFSPLHRNEPSGSLSGLTRVRRFHQDDAHVFCTAQQVSAEIFKMLGMLRSAYETFGFPASALELVLSTRPEQSMGSAEEWERAEAALRAALDASALAWSPNEGDGAFYGPKIDVRLVDALGRKHQTATIQLDFQLPRRFELHYKNEHGEAERPVMIHRAILGSAERFLAILLEAGQGEWPFWISPRQAVVVPIGRNPLVKEYAQRVRQTLALGDPLDLSFRSPSQQDDSSPDASSRQDSAALERQSAQEAQELLHRAGRPLQTFHVEVDGTAERLDKRVRRAEMGRINFVLVVGEKEMENGTVNVRARERAVMAGSSSGAGAAGGAAEVAAAEAGAEVQVGRRGWERVIKKDMGEWEVGKLRELFCYLDSHHL